MEKRVSWKDKSNQFIENMGLLAKVAMTIGVLWGASEMALYSVEPIARAIAIPALKAFAYEDEPINPEYLPIHTQIENAMESAQSKGIRVTYNRLPDRAKITDFVPVGSVVAIHSLEQIIRGDPFNGRYFKYLVFSGNHELLPDQVDERITIYGSFLDSYNITRIEGSGFKRRNTPLSDLRQLKEFITKSVEKNNNQPIESWLVLEYWLCLNNGNLNESLHDTAISLEALAMNDISTDDLGASTTDWDALERENITFYIDNIVDQFNLLGSYSDTAIRYGIHDSNPNQDVLQRIRLYGMWVEAANLDMFSPEIIVAMRGVQDWGAYKQYGLEKVVSSEVQALDIYRVYKYLLSIPE